MPQESPRIARRRAATKSRILQVAAERFAAAGPEAVRLEEIAEAADVARGTLYSHFPAKESLICAIVRPLLERAVERAEELSSQDPVHAVQGFLKLYLELWRLNPHALRLSYRMTERPPEELQQLHETFIRHMRKAFRSAAEAGILRSEDPVLAVRILARVAVPLLELLSARPDGDRLF